MENLKKSAELTNKSQDYNKPDDDVYIYFSAQDGTP